MAQSNTPIPDDVRRFLGAAIDSVPHLEALLLLRGAPDASWSAATLAPRLYVSIDRARGLLEDLSERGLFRATGERYEFAPSDRATAATVDRLAEVYARNVVGVAEMIHTKPGQPAQHFAEAFRLRKEK